MKTMKRVVVLVATIMTMLVGEAMATNSSPPPAPTPQPTSVVNNNNHPEANANADADASAYAKANAEANAEAIAKQQQSMQQQQHQTANGGAGGQGGKGGAGGDAHSSLTIASGAVTANPVANGGHATAVVEKGAVTANPTATIEEGAVKNSVTGGTSSVSESGNSTNSIANDNHSSATGGSVTGSGNSSASGGTVAGSGNADVQIIDKSKNINVTLVPPSIPSLAPAPMIAECANCYIDYMYSILEACGATTQMVEVIKGKQLPVAKDVFVTMTTLANFPGIRKKRGNASVVPVIANSVPAKDTYECIAMVTVQAKGKNGHMLTPDELRIRAAQAGQFLASGESDSPLYLVLSRKATIQHTTLVTTGGGWSISPGGGGPIGDAIGSVTGTLGRSSGTATNDWTPELTGVLIRPKQGTGVTSEALGATDYAPVATSDSPPIGGESLAKPGEVAQALSDNNTQ